MPLLRYEIRVVAEDKVSGSLVASAVGSVRIPSLDGSFKSFFGARIEHVAGEIYTRLLKDSGAFERPYPPPTGGSSSSGPRAIKGYPVAGLSCATYTEYTAHQLGLPFPAAGATLPHIFPSECDCGGPKGHVKGGIWCRM